MKLVDILALVWLLAMFLVVLLSPFVLLGVLIMHFVG